MQTKLPIHPRKSPCFSVPDYMHAPQVYLKYGHQIRIWRTDLNASEDRGIRPIAGLMEWTGLETGLCLGLDWTYSTDQKPEWRPIKYILYSHFPSSQPCKDLEDVYSSTTKEIKWVMATLRREYEEKTRKRLMLQEPVGVFPQ